MDARRLAPAKSELPRVALAQEVDADIVASDVKTWLNGAPQEAISTMRIYSTELADFPWMYHFDTWMRLNPGPE